MRLHVNVTEALRNFSDYLNRVAYRGERFVLVRGGKPVAELSPVPHGLRLSELSAVLASLPPLAAEEAEAYGADLDRARAELNDLDVRDAWDS